MDDFIAEARANPRKLKVSVSGLRSANDINVQQLNKLAGLRIVTVPFTGGGGEATLAALGGRVDGTVGFAPGMKGQIDAGKLRVLAVFQQGKYDLLPDAKPIGETPWKETFPAAYYVDRAEGPAEAGTRQTAGGLQGHRRKRRVQELPEAQRLYLGSQVRRRHEEGIERL